MINRQLTPGLHRSALLALLAAWLLNAGGCAQMGFPEWPQTVQDPPAATDTEEGDSAEGDSPDADSAVAEASEPEPEREPGQLYDWTGDGREVTRIVIDTNTQLANFYAGNERVGWTTIATGVSTHPTPRGQFSILEKVRDKRSNLYGKLVRNGKVIRSSAHGRDPVPQGARFVGASMPHFMRLTYDGIGMHAGPIPNPGQPASHGCIRMPPQMAEAVFAHVGPSTAVTVVGNGPDYGNYAERIARQREEARARRQAEERARRQAEQRARRAAEAEAAASTPRQASAAQTATADTASPGAGDGAADASEAPAETASATAAAQPEPEADAAVSADTESNPASGSQAATEAHSTRGANDGSRDSNAGAADAETSTRRSGSESGSGSGAAASGETSAEAAPEATPTRQSGEDQPQQRARPETPPPPAPQPSDAQPSDPQPSDTEPAQPAAPRTPSPPTIRAAGDEPVPAPQI
ncbi:hypothetical protein CKO31_13765 [Thiohalocapsa halophila]|uniref:L,D-TPase catalytic domain-containing protein n=1 Tax=Thiohalocapsa halophila TaxID=69359 RepID=A0ABS1CIY6_9GAMM|nr:L,D-transpeptidase [Thiohalocapsa halophila]MBK1631782.1 hypothetical protein [Thiohalocapsa halophila]